QTSYGLETCSCASIDDRRVPKAAFWSLPGSASFSHFSWRLFSILLLCQSAAIPSCRLHPERHKPPGFIRDLRDSEAREGQCPLLRRSAPDESGSPDLPGAQAPLLRFSSWPRSRSSFCAATRPQIYTPGWDGARRSLDLLPRILTSQSAIARGKLSMMRIK